MEQDHAGQSKSFLFKLLIFDWHLMLLNNRLSAFIRANVSISLLHLPHVVVFVITHGSISVTDLAGFISVRLHI